MEVKMIVNFSIQNFGSIKDKQILSFEASGSTDLEDYYIIHSVNGLRLLKLGLIYGANASGKSTILKALDFLRAIVLMPANKKTEELRFYPFLFDSYTSNESSRLTIEFVQNNVRYYYEVEFNKQAIVREELNFYRPNKANVFKRTTDLEKQFTQINFGSKIKIDKAFEKALEANTLWNNTVLGGFLKTNIEQHELKEITDWFSHYLGDLIDSDRRLEGFVTSRIDKSEIKKEVVIDILKKADFNISDIVIKKERKLPEGVWKIFEALELSNETMDKIKNNPPKDIEFEHTVKEKKYSLPFNLESQGTQRYYGFAGLLASLIEKPNALLIDELESSLHPDLYTHFLLSFLINAKSSQILATTHNREVLNNRDTFRNDVIWFTEKNELSATQLYSLDDFDSKIIRDSSNIYNAYKIGKLGGVPNLGDYYVNMANEN
jgi:AAA15 family ATPase/GTPase